MRKYIIYLVTFLFFSCEQEELPILPHNQGNLLTKQIELGIDYKYQVFYDLGFNSVVSNNIKSEWDLGFHSINDGYHIILNSSTYSSLAYIDNSLFTDTVSTSNLSWTWDNPNGDLDSTAFEDSRNRSGFYIYDRGFDINGNSLGFKKIKINLITDEYYQISYSNLDNSDYNSLNIYKDQNVDFTCFSFNSNSIENIQPYIDNWDLLFTQYTHLYSDTTTPAYLVTGVISNSDIEVATNNSYEFDEINYSIINELSFNSDKDALGFDWKEYNFDEGFYTVNSNVNYIIKDKQQRYFKLRFIDFYDVTGDKGYPTFEVQEL